MKEKYHFSGVFLYLLTIIVIAFSVPIKANMADFDHFYDLFLKEYWHSTIVIHGIETTVFDYPRMSVDATKNDSLYLKTRNALLTINPDKLPLNNDTKAFWINVYNFAAMELIIENYPVTSIRDFKISLFKHPWSKKVAQVGDQTYSLEQIEKEILLERFHDPRIVFAVSCAAVSCPDRIPDAFHGNVLDKQLDSMIKNFFRNPVKGLSYNRDADKLTLSWILKKDRDLFGNSNKDLLGFVCKYIKENICDQMQLKEVEIHFFKHDWTLNDIALAGT